MNNIFKQIIESKFNFNIDIEGSERYNSLSKSKYNSISLKKLYLDYLYMVDLGLPSETLWCKYNLNVNPNLLSTPKDWYGDYYAWGETETQDDYIWKTYKYGVGYNKLTKYCTKPEYGGYERFEDKLNELLLEDDAAYLNMHLLNYKFRIPVNDLFEELLEYTTTKWVENYNDINGLNGKIFKSKTNDNEMFIPAAGYCYGSEVYDDGLEANLWSSSLFVAKPNNAKCFSFNSKFVEICINSRNNGFSIRPVLYTN